jgi:hypothetical protein
MKIRKNSRKIRFIKLKSILHLQALRSAAVLVQIYIYSYLNFKFYKICVLIYYCKLILRLYNTTHISGSISRVPDLELRDTERGLDFPPRHRPHYPHQS